MAFRLGLVTSFKIIFSRFCLVIGNYVYIYAQMNKLFVDRLTELDVHPNNKLALTPKNE